MEMAISPEQVLSTVCGKTESAFLQPWRDDLILGAEKRIVRTTLF